MSLSSVERLSRRSVPRGLITSCDETTMTAITDRPSANDDDGDDDDDDDDDDVSLLLPTNDGNHTKNQENGLQRHQQRAAKTHLFNRISCWGQVLVMIACVMIGILIGSYDTMTLISHSWSPSSSSSLSSASTNSFAILSTDTTPTSSSSTPFSWLALRPGELPGYTGWARPEFTLAGYFQLLQSHYDEYAVSSTSSSSSIEVEEDHDDNSALGTLRLIAECTGHEYCHSGGGGGGALFYLRMYGPSVITGLVQDYQNGTYEFLFEPMDAGLYTVEVVVTYSHPPLFDVFPLPASTTTSSSSVDEPKYEGYLLAGFPLVVRIPTLRRRYQQQRRRRRPRRRLCSAADLTETSVTSAYRKARWVVTDRVNQPQHDIKTMPDSVNLEQYKWSLNSLGIQMQYQYHDCDILPDTTTNRFYHVASEQALSSSSTSSTSSSLSTPSLPTCLQKSANSNLQLQFLFIGDSNMRLQKEFLESYLSQLYPDGYAPFIQVTLIELFGGMLKCQHEGRPNVKHFLEKRAKRHQTPGGQRLVIIVNSGLHDIHRLCGQQWKDDRATYLNDMPDVELSCSQLYRDALADLVRLVAHTPATLRIFQTTTAGWPKYGNVGVSWPTDNPQQMPLSPDFVARFNEIAFDVLRGPSTDQEHFAKTIQITDAYWLTLPRPDHREVDEVSSIGKKLAHPGLEILSVLNRILMTLALEALQCLESVS